MQNFYKETLLVALALLMASGGLVYFGTEYTSLEAMFLPAENSTWPWWLESAKDKDQGGSSSIKVLDSERSLRFKF